MKTRSGIYVPPMSDDYEVRAELLPVRQERSVETWERESAVVLYGPKGEPMGRRREFGFQIGRAR